MHLTGPAKAAAVRAIADHTAQWIEAASFECDGVKIKHYCLRGRVLRCEYDADYDERRIDEVEGRELADFMYCHRLL